MSFLGLFLKYKILGLDQKGYNVIQVLNLQKTLQSLFDRFSDVQMLMGMYIYGYYIR